jgi:peroxin-14
VPLIKPPTPPELENDKALVTAKFDEAQQTLDLLKQQTTELKEAQEEQGKKIEEALESVEKAVSDLQESGKRREADIRSFKSDIDNIRELIPKVHPTPLKYDADVRQWIGIKTPRIYNYRIFRMNLNP